MTLRSISSLTLVGIGLALICRSVDLRGETESASVLSSPAALNPGDLESQSSLWDLSRLYVDGRIRYEYGDLEGREDSTAFTVRNRAGFESATESGFSLLGELEHAFAPFGDDNYRPYPGPGRTVIADPENEELNRLQLAYHDPSSDRSITAGRQRMIWDDARFIGNVGWRQNEQTYDALKLETDALDQLTIQYAYLWRVNRIFGRHAPAPVLRRFKSDSHLLNLRYEGLATGTLTAFAYLLDFREVTNLSSQTYGIRYNGTSQVSSETSFFYDLMLANQEDYRGNAAQYSAMFYRLEGGINMGDSLRGGAGYEVLGSDRGRSFQAPLGTNHKFNGFADAFLTTPVTGLQDYYTYIKGALPSEFKGSLAYHYFSSDERSRKLGTEVDVTVGHKLGEHATGLLKAAWLFGAGSQPDITRLSIQTEYTF